jgi:hypothetical protein
VDCGYTSLAALFSGSIGSHASASFWLRFDFFGIMVAFNSVLFVSAFLGATVSAASYHGANTDRVLRAATKRSNIFRRSMRIEKKFNAELSFVESKSIDLFIIKPQS